jgi:2-polyprenyl-3-methyl-5-hydroxy-6-metoxy-1,4-benzoquinol methylase
MGVEEEKKRIIEAYKRRDEEHGRKGGNLYQFTQLSHPADLLRLFIVENHIVNALLDNGFSSLRDLKILDVGCGGGGLLRQLLRYGATPENLYGVDLLEDRVEVAKRLSPNINFWCGDASGIPYEGFDVIFQNTVFTSIKSDEMKEDVAREMLRVLKPGGMVLWYDYLMNNPKNRDVKGVKREEIYRLFKGCDIRLRRVTLAPPILRIIAPLSYTICLMLEHVPFLCTHYFAVIRPRGRAAA